MATPHVTGTAAVCIKKGTGTCTGSPIGVIGQLRSDAAARVASYGFVGDPNHKITSGGPNGQTLYYGYLIYAGGY